MGTVLTDSVPPGSLDRYGLSITTATRSPTDLRAGTIYDPATFAAAVPVYFHPMGGSVFLGLFDGYWTAATPVPTEAGMYSAHTAVAAPAAVIIDASTGQRSRMAGLSDWPLLPAGRLISAASAARTLYTIIDPGTPALMVWTIDREGILRQTKTITLPINGTVHYDRGVYLDGPFLYLWGSDDTTHAVYTARVLYARLGIDAWSYQTDTGWTSQDAATTAASRATPVPGLATQGPMSTVVIRNRTYVSVVNPASGSFYGQIFASRSLIDPWLKLKEHVIAPTADWLGNNLMLQPQITVNGAALPGNTLAAIPYTLTYTTEDAGGEGLFVFWDLLAVPASFA